MSKRYILLIIFLLLLSLIVMGYMLLEREVAVPFQVIVLSDAESQRISCWENDNGQLYVFLPGFVEMADLHIMLNTDTYVSINDITLQEGMTCAEFALNTQYTLEYIVLGKLYKREIVFVRSEGIATLFVSTDSQRTDYLHADKENKETGTVSLYTTDGELNYCGIATSIGGRGNYTWKNSEKKPYNIILAENAKLLNMGKGSKWVLLSNASDSTLMRNKIVYDFANEIGLSYSPESRWINLYLNDEYRGVYLICEAVEIGEDRVAVSQANGVILTVETEDAFQEENANYFVTDGNVALEVKSARNLTEDQLLQLKEKVQSVENAILAESGTDAALGASWKELIDASSWIKKYLIEEIFANHDAMMRSANYYYQDESSQLYAGPVWDYDLAIGNENAWQLQAPQAFWANRLASQPSVEMPWYHVLYQKDEFYQEMVETYKTEFLPALERLIEVTIPAYTKEISVAAVSDKIRWGDDTALEEHTEWLSTYMEQRIEFLNNVWIEQWDYYVVRAVQQWGGYYVYYVVFQGETLENLPEFEDTETARFVGWYDETTDIPINITQPITEDIEIYAKWEDRPSDKFKQIMKLTPLGCIAIIGIGLVWIEFERMRKSR